MSNTTSTKKILNSLGTFIALVAIWGLFFGLGNRAIGSAEGIESIVQQTVVIGIAAIGMTFIIISAGIDLSIGSAIALCSVVGAKLAVTGTNPLVTVSVTLISGLLIGLFIGLLVVRAKLIPFITTLGTLLILRGLA